MKRLGMALLILTPLLALAPGAARASQQGVVAMKNWKTMDQCAKEAQAAFPDFTADSQAKRDARAVSRCRHPAAARRGRLRNLGTAGGFEKI
jgi:hypothetical protein